MDPLVAAEDKSRDRRASKSSRHMNVAEKRLSQDGWDTTGSGLIECF